MTTGPAAVRLIEEARRFRRAFSFSINPTHLSASWMPGLRNRINLAFRNIAHVLKLQDKTASVGENLGRRVADRSANTTKCPPRSLRGHTVAASCGFVLRRRAPRCIPL